MANDMKSSKPIRSSQNMIEKIFAETQLREAGYVMPEHHCHPYYELFYVETGECRILIDNAMYDLHAGDFILMPPQSLHYTRYLFGPCRRAAVFFRDSDITEDVQQLLPHQPDFFARTRIFQVPEAHREQIRGILIKMIAEEKIGDDYSAALQQALLRELFLLCGRLCTFPEEAPAEIHTTDRQIVQAARFISDHYAEPISAADIASAAGFSPNYLSRKFRAAAGLGLHQYLLFIRMKHAALELISTTDSVTEIAFRCGFSDSNYFKDAFKKFYGLTPSAYRKEF